LSHSPIFIIGAARSGTKFLRDCLLGDPRICAVPYDVNYIWRYGAAMGSDDVLTPEGLDPRRSGFIRTAIARQARLKPGGILLEKTVSNSLRVPFVDAIFPEARYIHLVRDGRDVATSAMKEWVSPPDYGRLLHKLWRIPVASIPYLFWYARKSVLSRRRSASARVAVWGPRYPGIEADVKTRSLAEVCALQWQKSVEHALADLARLPADRVQTIRYEDLVADGAEIGRLSSALGLDVQGITAAWQATVSPGRKRAFSATEQATRAEIEKVQATTLRTLGYL
jgi:hypothetical protein